MDLKNHSYAWIQCILLKLWVWNLSGEELLLDRTFTSVSFFLQPDIQLKNIHTSVKYFCWQEKFYLWREKKNGRYIERKINNFERFFNENLRSYVENNCCDYVYISRRRHSCECLITCLKKSTSESGLEFLLVFFTLINSYVIKAYIEEYNLLPGCAFGSLTYACYENWSYSFLRFRS